MSLSSMMQKILDEESFDPKIAAYRDSLRRRINEVYMDLCQMRPWLFCQRHVDVQLYAKVEGSATQTVTSLSGNLRQVSPGSDFYVQGWEGHVFIDPNNNEHIIGRVDTTPSANLLWLTTPLTATITGGNTDDWSIRFDRYRLPVDTIQALGWMDKTTGGYGRMGSLSARQEEMLFLDSAQEGQPGFIIEDDHVQIRQPEAKLTLSVAGSASGDDGLKASTKYEVRYTLYYEGQESAPSPVASVTTTAVKEITVAGVEELRWLPPGGSIQRAGKQAWIYMRDVDNGGRWYLWEKMEDNASPLLIDNLLPNYAVDRDDIVYYTGPAGQRKTFRAYATASSNRTITARIWYRPPELIAGSDQPVGPPAVESYIKNMVLSDILGGGESNKFERRAATSLRVLESSLAKKDERYVARNWKAELQYGSNRDINYRRLTAPRRVD